MIREFPRNSVQFKVFGRMALFTDPLTKIGGEKASYPIPTYQALKGVLESVYWKPTIVWIIDEMRVMKRVHTQSRGIRPISLNGGNDLSVYQYLADVEYEVSAHFEFNMHRTDLAEDRNEHKHHNMAQRMIKRGGRRDIFLGTRECQGYVEYLKPEEYGTVRSEYEGSGEISFGTMYHGITYADEGDMKAFYVRLWQPVMKDGVVTFIRPEECTMVKKIRSTSVKEFNKSNVQFVEEMDE